MIASLCDLRISNMDFDLMVICAWSYSLDVSALGVCGNVQIYIYIYIERERERDGLRVTHFLNH